MAGVVCALLAAVAADGAVAEFALLRPVKDATLIEDPAGALANGSGPGIFAGRINASSRSIRRTLIAFDVAAAIPPGSTVTGARLWLNLSSTSGGATTVGIHRLLADWGEGSSVAGGGGGAPALEGDSTWIHRFHDDRFWLQPGGDFDPTRRSAALVDQPGLYFWDSTPELTADVQSWLEDPAGNFGWILLGDETRPQTVKRFDSREHPDETVRPLLEVRFVPPCAPDPRGPGYWRRQCGAPEAGPVGGQRQEHRSGAAPSDIGAPPGHGGPRPAVDDHILFCAGRILGDLGLSGIEACEVLLAPPPITCEGRALRHLSVLVLNVCAGRLQTSCPVTPEEEDCTSALVGDLLEELAELIQEGECQRAAGCAGMRD